MFAVASLHLDTVRHDFNRFRAGDLDGMRRQTSWRRREVRRVAEALSRLSEVPTLIGGDLNLPPDSPMREPLRRRYRSAFEEVGRGYGFTYPSRWPWIRIDDVLAGPGWTVTRCRVGPDMGSDHRPVIAEVVIRGRPEKEECSVSTEVAQTRVSR